MNIYNVNDQNFVNSEMFQKFLKQNPGRGSLRIRAFAANQAIPIEGLRVIISKNIDGNRVIFFEGYTNESGVIEKIKLPTPKLDVNNLSVPNKATYNISTTYIPNNLNNNYNVDMYEDVCVVQDINIVPRTNFEMRDL